MKSELGRYKEALQYALKELERMHRSSGQRVRADVDAILNPPPEMEAVKVERWECKTCGTMFKSQVVSAGNSCCWGADTLIPLTGTFQRPKPQPVEKSESIHGVQINQAGRFLRYDSPVIEFPSAKGKTVTLTVTWEETPMSCKLCGAPWTIKIINDPYYGEYNMLMCAGSIPHTRPIPLANMTADLAFRARTAQMMGE